MPTEPVPGSDQLQHLVDEPSYRDFVRRLPAWANWIGLSPEDVAYFEETPTSQRTGLAIVVLCYLTGLKLESEQQPARSEEFYSQAHRIMRDTAETLPDELNAYVGFHLERHPRGALSQSIVRVATLIVRDLYPITNAKLIREGKVMWRNALRPDEGRESRAGKSRGTRPQRPASSPPDIGPKPDRRGYKDGHSQ